MLLFLRSARQYFGRGRHPVITRDAEGGLLGFIFLHTLSFPALSRRLSLISLLYPRDARLVYFLHPAYANGDKHCLQCRLTAPRERGRELVVRPLWKKGKEV